MSETPFNLPDSPSPRLAWLNKHGVQTEQSPKHMIGDEDEFGNRVFAWHAMIGDDAQTSVGGDTEQDAICNLAKIKGWKLWNEEGFNQ